MKILFNAAGILCISCLSITAFAQNPVLADTHHQFTYDANGNRIKREQIAINIILRTADPDSTHEELAGNEEQHLLNEEAATAAQQNDPALADNESIRQHDLFLAGHTIKAYPNPVTEQLSIEVDGLENSPNNLVRIYEMNGRLLSETRLQSSQQLDFSGYSAGTYLLTIWINGKRKEVEILKY